MTFFLRWVVGLALLGHSLMGGYAVYSAWPVVLQISAGEPTYPYLLLGTGLAKFLTGVFLLARTRFVFVPFVLWCASFAYLFLGSSKWSELPAQVFFAWMEQLAMLVFLLWLFVKRELR